MGRLERKNHLMGLVSGLHYNGLTLLEGTMSSSSSGAAMYIKSEDTHLPQPSSSPSSSSSASHDPAMPDGVVAHEADRKKEQDTIEDNDSDRTPLDLQTDTAGQYPPSPANLRQLSPTKTAASGTGSSASTRRSHTAQSAMVAEAEKGRLDGSSSTTRDLKALEDGSFSAPDQAQSILRW